MKIRRADRPLATRTTCRNGHPLEGQQRCGRRRRRQTAARSPAPVLPQRPRRRGPKKDGAREREDGQGSARVVGRPFRLAPPPLSPPPASLTARCGETCSPSLCRNRSPPSTLGGPQLEILRHRWASPDFTSPRLSVT